MTSIHAPLPLAALAVFIAASSAAAFPQFETKVPNGRSNGCLTCHVRSGGGEGWNKFGQEILRQGGADPAANANNQNLGFSGEPQWANLCDLDSDGDGASNGDELADPTCAWAVGDADPSGSIGAPGDDGIQPGDDNPPNPDNGRDTFPTDGGGGGDDGAGGCAATGASSTAAVALVGLAFALRRRRQR